MLLLFRPKEQGTKLGLLFPIIPGPAGAPFVEEARDPGIAPVITDLQATGDFGQGSQTFDATAALRFTATGVFGQGSQTFAGAGAEVFSGVGSFNQGSQTSAGIGAESFNATGTAGQGAGTFDASVSVPAQSSPSHNLLIYSIEEREELSKKLRIKIQAEEEDQLIYQVITLFLQELDQ